jgi:hypothetical protein
VGLAAAIAFAALGLSWASIVHAVSSDYGVQRPAKALAWDAGTPEALSEMASLRFEGARTDRDFVEATQYARRALIAAPLDGPAIRVLALDAERLGERARAGALMRLGGAVSWRDPLTQIWLFSDALARSDHQAASEHANALLKTQETMQTVLFPAILREMRDRRAIAPYVADLAEAPDWRRPFLSAITARGADPAVSRVIFHALEATRAPPTDAEIAGLLGRLLADQDYGSAREVWRSSLRSGREPVGEIYDEDFQGLPGAPPFNWRLTDADGAVAELERAADGSGALHVLAPAVRTALLAEQLLTLGPGAYRLSGESLVQAETPGDRFSWAVICAPPSETALAEVRQGGGGAGWQAFSVVFTVPAERCGAQWLRLSGLAHDGFDRSEGTYKKLRLQATDHPITGHHDNDARNLTKK